MKRHVTATEQNHGRADKLLAATCPEYSRAALVKLFELNLIKRGGRALKPGDKIRAGETMEYDLGPLQAKPEVIDLPVMYEDANVIVVNKPTGIISHARGRFWQEASVASFIRDKVIRAQKDPAKPAAPQASNIKPQTSPPDRAGIVHRLDRATSGVMICARNESALKFLQKQFHDRKVEKTYVAVISGAPEHEEAIIDAPIGRNLKTPKMFRVTADGKPAQTRYRVTNQTKEFTTLELRPKTGRTHQLRVHLKHIGLPIVGDELYGGKKAGRLMLHAHELTITLPDGTQKTFTAPLPDEFRTHPEIIWGLQNNDFSSENYET